MPNVEGGIENLLRCIPKRQLHRLGNTRYLIHSSYGAGQLVQKNINTNNFPKAGPYNEIFFFDRPLGDASYVEHVLTRR